MLTGEERMIYPSIVMRRRPAEDRLASSNLTLEWVAHQNSTILTSAGISNLAQIIYTFIVIGSHTLRKEDP